MFLKKDFPEYPLTVLSRTGSAKFGWFFFIFSKWSFDAYKMSPKIREMHFVKSVKIVSEKWMSWWRRRTRRRRGTSTTKVGKQGSDPRKTTRIQIRFRPYLHPTKFTLTFSIRYRCQYNWYIDTWEKSLTLEMLNLDVKTKSALNLFWKPDPDLLLKEGRQR